MDNYIGEIKAFPYNYVPQYWLPCTGQSLAVQEYQALFAVIGNLYNPTNTNRNVFYLPNLVGVVLQGCPVSVNVGHTDGQETVTLTNGQMTAHNHNIKAEIFAHASTLGLLTNQPGPTVFLTNAVSTTAGSTTVPNIYTYANLNSPEIPLSPTSLGITGTGGAHENRMPYLPLNFGICVNGMFPVRQ